MKSTNLSKNLALTQLKAKQAAALKVKRDALHNKRSFNYMPHAKQLEFHGLGNGANERLFLAGNRCGKTLCGAMEMAFHLTGNYPTWWQGRRFTAPVKAWAASVSVEATRDILQKIYLGEGDAVGAIPAAKIIRQTLRRGVSGAVDTVYISHKSGGVSSLGFKSYDQGREKFQGTSRDLIHLDEEPEIEIYEECLLRTLDNGGSILLTMTPLKGMTNLCEHFLNSTAAGRAVIRAGWDDTEHLSETDKTRFRATLRPHEVEAREKGIPTLGSGKVFPISEAAISCPRFDIPAHFKCAFGIDFGWTNPTAAVWGAYDADNDIVYIYDIYRASERSPAEHVAELKRRGEWISGVCDPAGQSSGAADGISLIERYAENGLYLNKADNTVEAGLMQMLERMQNGKLKVFDDLQGWWEEFRLYRRSEAGRIVKRHDHLMDASRYLIVSGLNLATTKPNSSKPFRREVADWRTV